MGAFVVAIFRSSFFISLGFLWCLGTSCSYQLRKGSFRIGGASSPDQTQRLFLPVMDNLSVKTGFEGSITSELRKSLSQVSGVELVHSPSNADLFLLGSILKYDLKMRSPRPGNAASEAGGGLLAGQSTAHDYTLTLEIKFQLIERENPPQPKREIWTRVFNAEGSFEASSRLEESGDNLSSGSASAPHINNSREQLLVKQLAQNIADRVLEQIVQDF